MSDQHVYSTRTIRRRFLGLNVERPQAPPGKMLILTGGSSDIVLYPGQRPTAGEAIFNRYTQVIEIDTSQRDLRFVFPAKALGGDKAFTVNFEAAYQVKDPSLLLNNRYSDPEEALRRVLKDAITRVTETHEIEDGQGATAAVRKMLDEGKFLRDLPFSLNTIHVTLDLDAQAKAYQEQMRAQKRAAELAAAKIAEIKAGGAVKAATVDVEEELKAKLNQHELERQKKMTEHYKEIVQGGAMSLLVEQLVQRPSDIKQVIDVMVAGGERQREANTRMLEVLLKEGYMDETRAAPIIRDLLGQLRTSYTSPFGDALLNNQRRIEDAPRPASSEEHS